MTKSVHGAFTEAQREERHREVKRRHAAAQQQAKTTLAKRYPGEYEGLWRAHLAALNAERGPLPHQEIADAHQVARESKTRVTALEKALKTVEGMPGMEEAAQRLREEIAKAQA